MMRGRPPAAATVPPHRLNRAAVRTATGDELAFLKPEALVEGARGDAEGIAFPVGGHMDVLTGGEHFQHPADEGRGHAAPPVPGMDGEKTDAVVLIGQQKHADESLPVLRAQRPPVRDGPPQRLAVRIQRQAGKRVPHPFRQFHPRFDVRVHGIPDDNLMHGHSLRRRFSTVSSEKGFDGSFNRKPGGSERLVPFSAFRNEENIWALSWDDIDAL